MVLVRRMIFERKIGSELMRWKDAVNRKPIVLRRARQVGKTFVVNRFAEKFDHFIDMNLERPKEAFDALERALILYRARASVSTQIPIIEKLQKAPKLFF